MNCGIYRIEFPNGAFYYGSSLDTGKRAARHKSDAHAGKHNNPRFQLTFDKYGDFTWEHLVSCDPLTRYLWEQSYLDEFVGHADCINAHLQARGGGANKGRKFPNRKKAGAMPPEQRAKIAEALRGQPKSPEAVAKATAAKVGRPRSDETKAKLIAANKGKVQSDETKAKRVASVRAFHARKKAGGAD